jgi:hypothetical protein
MLEHLSAINREPKPGVDLLHVLVFVVLTHHDG